MYRLYRHTILIIHNSIAIVPADYSSVQRKNISPTGTVPSVDCTLPYARCDTVRTQCRDTVAASLSVAVGTVEWTTVPSV